MSLLQNSSGTGFTAGIDEVGRGCLAGPVVACAVVLHDTLPPGVTDSKKLSANKRLALEPRIKQCCTYAFGIVWQQRIDAINILQATFEAMAQAVCHLQLSPAVLLIDGNKTIPKSIFDHRWQRHFQEPLPRQTAIIHGDSQIGAIAAASILAKNFRDRVMQRLARHWPVYGFERHVGYGTKSHLLALQQFGPCPLHRLTFRKVKPETVLVQGTLC